MLHIGNAVSYITVAEKKTDMKVKMEIRLISVGT
jgi:hypothetical protein